VPSHVVLRGQFTAPQATLSQSYPVVIRNLILSKGSIFTVASGVTLWAATESSNSTPMFGLGSDSQLILAGQAEKRVKIEPFQRLDGGATMFQMFSESSSAGYKIKLSHVDVDSTKLVVRSKGLLELDDVHAEMRTETAGNSMSSKGIKVTGTNLISMSGGQVNVLSPSTLKRNGANAFFSYTSCGRIEGLDNLVVDGVAGLSLTPVILLAEENDGQVANHCSEFYQNAGKKQILHHPSVAVASGANVFREAQSCFFANYTTGSWTRHFTLDCYTVANPMFENVSIVSGGFTYWTGNVTDDINSVGGDKWSGPSAASEKLLLKGPDGQEFQRFDTGTDVQLVIPDSEFHNGFTLEGRETHG
jgi:hypothetical protein